MVGPMNRREALAVINDFHKYLETGDESLVVKYSSTDIRQALNKAVSDDRNQGWYKEMERRADRLDQSAERVKGRKGRWKEKIIDWVAAFVVGVLVTIVAQKILAY